MPEYLNKAKQRLARGEVLLGFGVREFRSPEVARVAKACDHDWLQIDLEHGPMSLETASAICAAALDLGVAPIIRVPARTRHMASKALDAGAWGVQFPHVSTGDLAAELIADCRFPPDGRRGISATYPQLGYREMPTAEMTKVLNHNLLTIAMLEDEEALANLESIAATDGLDVLFIGAADLLASMNLHGQLDHPKVDAVVAALLAACRRHGKHAGLGGIRDARQMRRYIDLGVQWVASVSDLGLVLKGGREQARLLRPPQC